jgi:hypothetical protein
MQPKSPLHILRAIAPSYPAAAVTCQGIIEILADAGATERVL